MPAFNQGFPGQLGGEGSGARGRGRGGGGGGRWEEEKGGRKVEGEREGGSLVKGPLAAS